MKRQTVTLANASERCRDDESGTRPDERTELEEFAALINANARSSNGYWYWRDKPIAERGAARDILQEAGFDVANLVSRAEGEDPPNCEAPRPRSGLRDFKARPVFYRLRNEPHATILVACSKCDWKAAFDRAVLIASHGPDHLLTDLLGELASPTCSKVGHHWDRCGAYFVEPIDKGQ